MWWGYKAEKNVWMISLSVSIQYQSVTDRQTDRQTDIHVAVAKTALAERRAGKNTKQEILVSQTNRSMHFVQYTNFIRHQSDSKRRKSKKRDKTEKQMCTKETHNMQRQLTSFNA